MVLGCCDDKLRARFYYWHVNYVSHWAPSEELLDLDSGIGNGIWNNNRTPETELEQKIK